jgi:septum formation protein
MNVCNKPSFVLASASPARRRLLETAGIYPTVCQSNFDESQIQLSDAVELVKVLAAKKAEVVKNRYQDVLILGCDSVLSFAGAIYGKPESPQVALARWREMRGQAGLLHTGHSLIDLRHNKTITRCATTKVYFANISDRIIEDYITTGEPLKCAGSFALEGKGGFFVEKIEGCHSNVIGLSMPLLAQMLNELGYSVTSFW